MTHNDDRDALAAANSLGAVSPAERAEYEAVLAESGDARRDAAELAETAAQLGLSAAPVTPPADMKAALLARIAVTPQLPAAAADAAAGTATAEPAATAEPIATAERTAPAAPAPTPSPSPQPTPTPPGPREAEARRRWYTRPAVILGAAAAAIVLFLAGVFVGSSSFTSPAPDSSQALDLAELSAAADVQRAVADLPDGGTATLIWSLEQQRSAIVADGLTTLPSDSTYQLWYVDAAGPVSAGTFDAATSGESWRVLDGTLSAGDTVAITVEPEGGSEAPTTDPILAITAS